MKQAQQRRDGGRNGNGWRHLLDSKMSLSPSRQGQDCAEDCHCNSWRTNHLVRARENNTCYDSIMFQKCKRIRKFHPSFASIGLDAPATFRRSKASLWQLLWIKINLRLAAVAIWCSKWTQTWQLVLVGSKESDEINQLERYERYECLGFLEVEVHATFEDHQPYTCPASAITSSELISTCSTLQTSCLHARSKWRSRGRNRNSHQHPASNQIKETSGNKMHQLHCFRSPKA